MTSSIINRFSTIATDPLRNFRFYAEFTKAGDETFTPKILTGSDKNQTTNGASNGWIGGFSYINGLNVNIQPITYREGGYNTTVHQIPGMASFSPITMQRGTMYGNDQAMTWMRGLFAAAAGNGLQTGVGKNFRVDVKVYVLDHPNAAANSATNNVDDNIPKLGFKIHNAWISQLNYSDLNAGSNEILFESMVLVHEGLSVFFTDSDFNPIGATV